MTALSPESELAYLQTPGAIRDRAEALYALALGGKLEHFVVDEAKLDEVAARVVRVTRASYPDVHRIPYHARYRHFAAGGVDRLARVEPLLAALSPEDRLATEIELVITSVLLDAGAGASWSYVEPGTGVFTRSEGLAVASFDWFVSGGFSANSSADPLRADASVLATLTPEMLAQAFQVTRENPLVGLEGRASVLRALGNTVRSQERSSDADSATSYFGAVSPRLGGLGRHLVRRASGGALAAPMILQAVLGSLGPIWPGRETFAGTNLGDVWTHHAVGRVPFHKLSQWLTYSLVEPLEHAGITVTHLNDLTGLAEYRNGGLFVDGGVLVPRHARVLEDTFPVFSPVVVEWRALTVALLDRTAIRVRELLGLSAEEFPLAKVLEGGTWAAGRELAKERRADASPPIRVESDGTVF